MKKGFDFSVNDTGFSINDNELFICKTQKKTGSLLYTIHTESNSRLIRDLKILNKQKQ